MSADCQQGGSDQIVSWLSAGGGVENCQIWRQLIYVWPHMGGREVLSYEWARCPFIWAGAGPFHIIGREAISYWRGARPFLYGWARGPFIWVGARPFPIRWARGPFIWVGGGLIFSSAYHLTLNLTSTTPSCSGPIPAQKSRDNSVLGVVFSHTMPKMDFRYSHRFSWEKTH